MFKISSYRKDLSLLHRVINRNFSGNSSVESIETSAKKLKRFEQIPGPKSYPYIGSLYKYLPIIGDYNAETLDQNAWLNYRRYGDLVRETPGVNLLHVFDPDDIEAIFRQDSRLPARRSHVAMWHYRLSKPHIYNTGGLLSTNGPEWWRLRSAFQKNFTSPQSVRGHIEKVDEILKEFVQWIKNSKVSANTDFLPYLNRLNLEVIGKVAFNERFHSFSASEQDSESRSSQIIEASFGSNCGIFKLDKGLLWRYFETPLYKRLVRSQECLEKISTEILMKRIHLFESTHEKDIDDKSLLKTFLQQDGIDLKDVLGMMVDIFMAAIDTTAYSTCFALYHIARNEKCQEKLFHEISTLLPEKNSVLNAKVLSNAVYLRACVKESLRLNPVSIGVGRYLQKDIVLRGYLIPKETVIVTQNMVANRLPQYVKNPLQYKPERWLRDSSEYENMHPFLTLPFGFGPRSCIARRLAEQNICLSLIRILREFKLKWIGDDLGIQTHLINKPDSPISLSFMPRR